MILVQPNRLYSKFCYPSSQILGEAFVGSFTSYLSSLSLRPLVMGLSVLWESPVDVCCLHKFLGHLKLNRLIILLVYNGIYVQTYIYNIYVIMYVFSYACIVYIYRIWIHLHPGNTANANMCSPFFYRNSILIFRNLSFLHISKYELP